MKHKPISNRFTALNIMLMALVIFLIPSCDAHKDILEAYETRISGNADFCISALQKILADDPEQAEAWYELARSKHHVSLGNPKNMVENFNEIQQAVDKAVEFDSDNVIYAFYKAYIYNTIFYMGLQYGIENPEITFANVVDSYERILELNPDFHEAKLYMVELYARIPAEIGGDSLKAEQFVLELETADTIIGARAREMILPETADFIGFWQDHLKSEPDNAEIYEALGKSYLYENNVDEAVIQFEKAMQIDQSKNILNIDLARYHMMQAMQNPQAIEGAVPLMENAFKTYLESEPEPINPLKAYVTGLSAVIKYQTGDQAGGDTLNEKALSFDNNFSRAFGIPSQILFAAPDEIVRRHEYFFRPF